MISVLIIIIAMIIVLISALLQVLLGCSRRGVRQKRRSRPQAFQTALLVGFALQETVLVMMRFYRSAAATFWDFNWAHAKSVQHDQLRTTHKRKNHPVEVKTPTRPSTLGLASFLVLTLKLSANLHSGILHTVASSPLHQARRFNKPAQSHLSFVDLHALRLKSIATAVSGGLLMEWRGANWVRIFLCAKNYHKLFSTWQW